MPEKKIQKIAEDADLIVKGYAFKAIPHRNIMREILQYSIMGI